MGVGGGIAGVGRTDAQQRPRYIPRSNQRVRSCEEEGRSKTGVSSDPCGITVDGAKRLRRSRWERGTLSVSRGKASGLWLARAGISTRIEIRCLGIAQKAIVKGSQGL